MLATVGAAPPTPMGTTERARGGRMRAMTQPARDGELPQPFPKNTADGVGGSEIVRDRVVVVTPEGMAVSGGTDEQPSPSELIEQPAKVMRIGSMIKQLLEEVRTA